MEIGTPLLKRARAFWGRFLSSGTHRQWIAGGKYGMDAGDLVRVKEDIAFFHPSSITPCTEPPRSPNSSANSTIGATRTRGSTTR